MVTIMITSASSLTQRRQKHHHYDPSTRHPAGRLRLYQLGVHISEASPTLIDSTVLA